MMNENNEMNTNPGNSLLDEDAADGLPSNESFNPRRIAVAASVVLIFVFGVAYWLTGRVDSAETPDRIAPLASDPHSRPVQPLGPPTGEAERNVSASPPVENATLSGRVNSGASSTFSGYVDPGAIPLQSEKAIIVGSGPSALPQASAGETEDLETAGAAAEESEANEMPTKTTSTTATSTTEQPNSLPTQPDKLNQTNRSTAPAGMPGEKSLPAIKSRPSPPLGPSATTTTNNSSAAPETPPRERR